MDRCIDGYMWIVGRTDRLITILLLIQTIFIQQKFLDPVRKKKILTPEEIGRIFSNIEIIKDISFELHSKLEHRKQSNPQVIRIGDLFLEGVIRYTYTHIHFL